MKKWNELARARMRELGLTQEKLAERLGVTQGGVGHWIRGRNNPPLPQIDEILRVLGMGRLGVIPDAGIAEPAGGYATQALGAFRYPLSDWEHLAEPAEGAPTLLSDHLAEGPSYWLAVEGDAMNSPIGLSVPAGMLVLVDSGRVAEVGALVIARVPGNPTAVFRQWVEEGGQQYLLPLNPTWPKTPWEEGIEVLGVVVQASIRLI
ncbi:helix-turn-helix domain-containing protein [Pseudomonas sp. MAFF212428]|uniref:Helix-turn-helix domain-containing protein n=1 Tax=Pseudomonas brassicae TaxID=2708063 RepID=A0A6B3NX33_9PSED|nr:S24 family peptidase [Pseudomonas brassicae]NER62546.1 helix-turn-helix domain-containing protein [Pseudomonas brassicae]NER66606.1 helix-turn-helix domain-containing protein [Pseudomonas brassicae]